MRLKVDRYEQMLILASFVWGTSFVATKLGVEQADPLFFAFIRFTIGAEVLVIVAVLVGSFDLSILKDKMIWGIGLLNAIGLALQNVGMTQTSATNSVLLVDINVVFVALIASVVLKEQLRPKTIMGMLIGLIGVAIVATEGDLSQMFGGTFTGNLIVFLAGVVWAFYIVYQKKTVDRHKDAYLTATGVIMATAICSLPLTIAFSRNYTLTATGMSMAIYLGVFGTAFAFLLYLYGLKGKGATDSSIILLLEIVFAMFFAFAILAEMPTIATAVGGALIVGSIIIVSFQENGKG
jgi:drug/metabolite transporter (DMT)-like permease